MCQFVLDQYTCPKCVKLWKKQVAVLNQCNFDTEYIFCTEPVPEQYDSLEKGFCSRLCPRCERETNNATTQSKPSSSSYDTGRWRADQVASDETNQLHIVSQQVSRRKRVWEA